MSRALVDSGFTQEQFLAAAQKREFSDKERKAAADKGQAMPDGSYPIKNRTDLKNAIQAFGRAKNPDAVKKHIIARAKALGATNLLPEDWSGSTKGKALAAGSLSKARIAAALAGNDFDVTDAKAFRRADCEARAAALLGAPRAERVLKSLAMMAKDPATLGKGMWTVSQLAVLIGNLFDLQCGVAAEKAYEEDDSQIADDLADAVKALGQILEQMAEEEVAEMFPEGEDEGDDVDVVQLAERIGELAKRGAKHSADTMGHLQSMHDHLAKMTDGKVCAGAEKDEKTGDLAKLQAEHKTMHATLHEVQAALAKLTAERETQDAALKKAQADLAAAQAEVKRLADMPAPSETRLRGDLRVVGKTDDVNKPADEPPQPGEKPLAFNITPHPGQSGYDAVRMAFAGARSIVKSA